MINDVIILWGLKAGKYLQNIKKIQISIAIFSILYNRMMERKVLFGMVAMIYLIFSAQSACIHDHFISNVSFHFYDDLSELGKLKSKQSRLLQTISAASLAVDSASISAAPPATTQISNTPLTSNNLRIYIDYNQLQTGGNTEINLIKRAMNISANYYYNILSVPRVNKLYYPSNVPLQCNVLTVPSSYVTNGVVGDLGVLVSNQNSTTQYMAKSTACALLKSTNRPIWGVMIWNNLYLEYDQVGFQKVVYVAIHELTHILGYSAALYSMYPAGNPYRSTNNIQYLTSPLIQTEMQNYFNCSNPLGMILQDQDGTLIPSHNEKKVFGNQAMIASGKKGAYYSRMTLALLASTGWYSAASFAYTEPAIWGKNKGCNFLNIDNCVSQQFCTATGYNCDYDVTAMGACATDPFTGACKLYNYFTNTICIDENYELKNLNANMYAMERGGYNSRCFSSNFRQTGLTASLLNNRCYITVCSSTNSYLYILVGSVVLFCTSSSGGAQIPAPAGLEGTLTCPSSFANYCSIKKTCAYSCNKNGACVNGQCLCTGATILTSTCLDQAYTTNQMDVTGGLLNSIIDSKGDILILKNTTLGVTNSQKAEQVLNTLIASSNLNGKVHTKKGQSINSKCFQGTFFDPIFGDCTKCKERFGCEECTILGCISCPPGSQKNGGKCLAAKKL